MLLKFQIIQKLFAYGLSRTVTPNYHLQEYTLFDKIGISTIGRVRSLNFGAYPIKPLIV